MTNSTFPWANLPLNEFTTSDGANCFYYERKASRSYCSKGTILILCGWCQGPNNWSPVLLTNEYIKQYYDVYLLVMRGYKQIPDITNNHIARYSTDVKEFIETKRLNNIITCTHSMGCSIIWYLVSLYGEKYFDGYVVIDQPLVILINPAASVERNLELGSIFSVDLLFNFTNTSAKGPAESATLRAGFEKTCFTKEFLEKEPEIYKLIEAGTLNYQYQAVNDVFFNHVCNDYLDVVSKGFKRPALLIGGNDQNFVPYQTVIYQKQFYEDATVKIFGPGEGGSHSMYLENYSLFNQYLNEFLISKH